MVIWVMYCWESSLFFFTQGSLLSPVLYLIYNADIVEGALYGEGVSNAWVDDVALIAIGESEQETVSKLYQACQHLLSTGSYRVTCCRLG